MIYNDDDNGAPEDILGDFQCQFDDHAGYRKYLEPDLIEYERFYDGKQWKITDKRAVVNQIFKVIEYEVPILTDRRSGTDFVAIEEERQDDAKVLKEAVDYVYADQSLDMKLVKAVRTMLKTGMGYLYVDWDPDGEKGAGQIIIRNLNWRHVFLDPGSDDIDSMERIFIRIPENVNKLKRMYPPIADKIKPEDIDPVDYSKSEEILREDRYHGPGIGMGQTFKPKDMAYIYERWSKDYSMEPISEEETQITFEENIIRLQQGQVVEVTKFQDHAKLIEMLMNEIANVEAQVMQDAAMLQVTPDLVMGQEQALYTQLIQDLIEQHQAMLEQNPQGLKPKYPHFIRLTIRVCNEIAYDGPSPVPNGLYPVVPVYGYMDEGKPYATGEIKHIIDLQKGINELNYAEHMDLRLGTNIGWVKDDTSGVDETQFVNERGIVITKKAGTEVRRLEPAMISPNLAAKIEFYKAEMRDISGMTESATGTRPQGVSAAKAITALQEQALVRSRLKERQIAEYSVKRLGELVASFVIWYWSKERILRVYDDSGRIKTVGFDPKRLQDLRYLVRISPGTTFGLNNEAINNHMKELFELGIIDGRMLVKASEIPFKGQILSYLEERDQLQQQALALQEENAMLNEQLAQLGLAPPAQEVMGQVPPQPEQMS